MKKKYFGNGVIVLGLIFLLNACQHFSKKTGSTLQPLPSSKMTETGQKKEKDQQKKSDKIKIPTDKETYAQIQKAQILKTGFAYNDPKFSRVFEKFGDGTEEKLLRQELLFSMVKPGEMVIGHRAEKKLREQKTGVREKKGIEEMAEYRRNITIPIGTTEMLYENGNLMKEYSKALNSLTLKNARKNSSIAAKNGTYSINNVTFTERGPYNIPGRDRSLVISPTHPDKWYVGTAGGGVWITENAGTTWRNTTDFSVPNLSSSTLAISPQNPNIVYAGTGEPFGNLDGITGVGLIKSSDAGEHWAPVANTSAFGDVGRLLVNPANANHLLVGTPKGIYMTQDGGTTWTQPFSGAAMNSINYSSVQDIVATNDFGVIYAAVNTLGIMKSTDGGLTWTKIFDAVSLNKGIERIELSICHTDQSRIYLSCQELNTTGLYMSRDAGTSFQALTFQSGNSKEILGDQGWYDNTIATHPTNADIFYVGGVYLAKITVNTTNNSYNVLSIASGYNTAYLNTSVHPDQHGIVCQVNSNDPTQFRLLLTNDGGVYSTQYKVNPGETQGDWSNPAKGLNTTQFYGADKKNGENAYVAGAQDNGSAATITAPSSGSSDYLSLYGGDGFETLWNYNKPNELLFGSQYNNFVRAEQGVSLSGRFNASNADNGSASSPFYSKLANANNNPDVVFTVSSNGVWRSLNFGRTWDLTSFTPANNGTWPGNSSYATVKVSVANPDVVWAAAAVSPGAGTAYKVNVSKDNGLTFAKTTGNSPTTSNLYISGLSPSNTNEARAYVLHSAASQPKVVKTNDFGATWTDISGYSTGSVSSGFPNVPVHSLIEMPFDENVLWAGTDIGVFETINGGTNWYPVTTLPPVSVWQMKIVNDQVVLATHGRGVWTATIPELTTYVLPEYVPPPNITSIKQAGIHDMKAVAVFNYTNPQITSLKVFVDNTYVSTISSTQPNTDYTFTTNSSLPEGVHTVSVLGVYGSKETIKTSKSVEIINFNAGAPVINIPSFTANDVYIGTGKFVVDNVSNKFSYNVLNNVGHPYAGSTNYQTYVRTPVIIGAGSPMTVRHMAFTEAGYDYAYVEGSKDLVTWKLLGVYDEASFSNWTNAGTPLTAATVNETLFQNSSLNLTGFALGEEIAVRLRMESDTNTESYGWLIKSIIPTSALGVNDIIKTEEGIRLAPNPANDHTSILLPSNNKKNVDVYIYDASGRQVISLKKQKGSKIDIDVKELSKGLYLVLVKTDTQNKALKLIKN
ncbi:T9SS type A sorting domain-containing protein [Chryseobacterium sp. JM1]|uniref:T9SS type A sorting domain-containing protein n=1 Tax=Chryseobacterium sp. JM1 TaxID=1233950 RepID=UPI00068ACE04|nr:T9SS type A sorting domain-containing protein [Chryseobacterium sp. JM1]